MPTDWTANPGRHKAILLAFCALIGTGCAHERGIRSRAGQDSSTIAKDRSAVPRGQVIPPAGLGVDLVRSSSLDDNELRRTSFSRLGVPDSTMH
jgi:hypothetical protein